jgi:hypothetical protein
MTSIEDSSLTTPYVELHFEPNWDYLSTVRTFIISFIAISISDKKKADEVAMSVNELLENAIKYSCREGIGIDIRINKPEKPDISVSVSNFATQEAADALIERISRIYEMPPMEAYLAFMKESISSTDGESRIGLARIRYEAGAMIRAEYNNGKVTVYARFDRETAE